MLRIWNVSLVLATGVLAILGTFLVRSGVLQSIHAFGASTLGVPFLVLIGVMIAGSIYLVASRSDELRSQNRLDSLLSREAIFLLNNLLLVALCFVIFWGTFFPLIAEAVTGRQRAIGPPVYEQFVVPLALLLVLATGIGPVIAWRRATASNLRRNLGKPALFGALVVVALIALGVTGSWTALAMFGLAGFVLAGIVQEFWRGVRARRTAAGEAVPRAFVSLIARNRRRYGGYFVHVGIIVLFVGVAASSSFKTIHDVALNPGEKTRVAGYEFTYVKPTAQLHAAPNGRLERIAFGAELSVRKGDGAPKVMHTSKDYFPSQDPTLGPVSRFFDGETTTEVALDASLGKDVWAAVAPDTVKLRDRIAEGDRLFERAADDLDADQSSEFMALALRGLTDRYTQNPPPARFRLEVNPMVTWIWIGALLAVLGGFIAGWPPRRGLSRGASARYRAQVGREVREPETVGV